MTKPDEKKSVLYKIDEELFYKHSIDFYIKRDDLIHPEISGNKWRKLKYNIQEAISSNAKGLITFGGAYSNHLAATAAAGKLYGFETLAILRGKHIDFNNITLKKAKEYGMEFIPVSFADYKKIKEENLSKDFIRYFPEFILIPEGGSNYLAVKGVAELVSELPENTNYIYTGVGSGGTVAGLIAGAKPDQIIKGVTCFKQGEYLIPIIKKLLTEYQDNFQVAINCKNWELKTGYHFGGFAKCNSAVIEFMIEFYKKHHILLDWIYTAKVIISVYDAVKNGEIERGTTVVALHTGGLQGNLGLFERFGNQNKVKELNALL
ncbi:MAG: pyridoxal-phosphate dependent enzyme [Vicingaceae bacterium]